jgi:nitroreductase
MAEPALGGGRRAGSGTPPRRVIDELVGGAVAAPSLHNTQPWRFRVRDGGSVIELLLDPARMLPAADPGGRAAHIACGAALFNLRLVAAVDGLRADIALLPDPGRPVFLAEVRLAGAGQAAAPWERELHAAIQRRQTNREPYSTRPVPPDIGAELAAAAAAEGAVLHLLDRDEALRVRRLAADAELCLLADPAYRAEVARWVGGARDSDGIPDLALGPTSPEGGQPVRRFVPGRPRPIRYERFEEHPQLAVLSVRAGGTRNWLAAGQALQRVWLTATIRGISCCPLTQPLETADAWLVRDPRSGSEQPQMILRIGYGPPIPAGAPRRAVTEVIDWPQAGETQPEDTSTANPAP